MRWPRSTIFLLATSFWTLGFWTPAGQAADEPPQSPKSAGQASSHQSAAAAPATKNGDSDVISLYLMDGSVIGGKLSIKEIQVDTQFGSLQIPVTSLKRFTPGLQSHPEVVKRISGWIADLGSSDFGKRDAATKELLKIGPPVRSELDRFSNDSDAERKKRVQEILAEFDQIEEGYEDEPSEAGSLEREALLQRDTVETTEFTVVGKIVPQEFAVSSPYGTLAVKLSDIRHGQRATAKKEDVRKSFHVDSSNMVHRTYLNSNIRVEKGEKVSVTADGTIAMTPWGNQVMSTPEGGGNFGWYLPNEIPSGALVARIGQSGKVFKVGSKHSFTVDRAGVLQFAIAMQSDYADNEFPGRYNLKVVVKRN